MLYSESLSKEAPYSLLCIRRSDFAGQADVHHASGLVQQYYGHHGPETTSWLPDVSVQRGFCSFFISTQLFC